MAHSTCLGCLGLLLVAFGFLVALKAVVASGFVLLALAIAFAAAHWAGVAGRWALVVAAVLFLLATPYLLVQTLGVLFGVIGWLVILVVKLVPLAFVALGVYVLYRALR
ncbi:MAG: hypothetical protein L6E13_11570 [Firmicutes bacterium]|nr:hypothetical protein [Bacillota bacterium]